MRKGPSKFIAYGRDRALSENQVAKMRQWFQQVETLMGLAWTASRLQDLIWAFGEGFTPREAVKEIDG